MLFTQKNPSLGESPGDRAELLSEKQSRMEQKAPSGGNKPLSAVCGEKLSKG